MIGRTKQNEKIESPVPTAVDGSSEQPKPQLNQPENNGKRNIFAVYRQQKKWSIPVTILVLILILLAVPVTRYAILGTFMKEQVEVSVADSTTHTAISGVKVTYGSIAATTNASGNATLTLPVGNHTISLTKQYYKAASSAVFVSFSKSKNNYPMTLVATGRQVPIKVINKITGLPVANAEIKVLDTEEKTDGSGLATIVLPVKDPTQTGAITATGYNSASVTVQVTDQVVTANTFPLTPNGTVYFLSNLSGTIDVVKTNLDGTDRATILAGTGNESPTNTVLLASRDWKYLALLSQRSASGGQELSIINTSTSAVSNVEGGDVTFHLVGWDDDRFIYQITNNNILQYQNGQQELKSYNAQTKSATTLYQTIATGQSNYLYIAQLIGSVYIIDSKVVYSLNWTASDTYDLQQNNKPAALYSVNPDGTDNTLIKNFVSAPGSQSPQYSINTVSYDEPNSIGIQFFTDSGNAYYEYQDGKVTTSSDLTDQNFYNSYPTYLESPSGNHTFWSQPADGKYNLYVGDASGQNQKTVAKLSDYSPYGWYTDQFLLVSKNSSELYIMPVNGGTPIPISDYFKPSQFYNNGYGGGYGGL